MDAVLINESHLFIINENFMMAVFVGPGHAAMKHM
jgi:hypothetical protein